MASHTHIVSYMYHPNGRADEELQIRTELDGRRKLFREHMDRWVYYDGEAGRRERLRFRGKRYCNEKVSDEKLRELQENKKVSQLVRIS